MYVVPLVVLNLESKKCNYYKEFGFTSEDHFKNIIHNLFGGILKNHLMSNIHIQNWC